MKISRFTSKSTGSRVTRVTSPRMTLYVPDEVPVAVLQMWLARLRLDPPRRISTLRQIRRRDTRRKIIPVPRKKRRRVRCKRIHIPIRFWRHEALR
jgi:hypothetical protein